MKNFVNSHSNSMMACDWTPMLIVFSSIHIKTWNAEFWQKSDQHWSLFCLSRTLMLRFIEHLTLYIKVGNLSPTSNMNFDILLNLNMKLDYEFDVAIERGREHLEWLERSYLMTTVLCPGCESLFAYSFLQLLDYYRCESRSLRMRAWVTDACKYFTTGRRRRRKKMRRPWQGCRIALLLNIRSTFTSAP